MRQIAVSKPIESDSSCAASHAHSGLSPSVDLHIHINNIDSSESSSLFQRPGVAIVHTMTASSQFLIWFR